MNAIELNNLSYSFPDGTEALCDVSFTLAKGERVGLIGPNGAGNSTLLLHHNGLLPERPAAPPPASPPPGAPPARVCDLPVAEPHLSAIRARVGLLFQDPDDQLFCPTVWEDVAFGPRQMGLAGAALDARVARALALAGLEGYETRLPHHLSRGEKRRVCLAGLFACEAQILALDEPTGNLDPRGRRE